MLPASLLLLASQCDHDSGGGADVPVVADVSVGREEVCGCCQYSPHNSIYTWRCIGTTRAIHDIYFIDMTDGRCCVNVESGSDRPTSAQCYVAPGDSVEIGKTEDGTPLIHLIETARECTPFDDDG